MRNTLFCCCNYATSVYAFRATIVYSYIIVGHSQQLFYIQNNCWTFTATVEHSEQPLDIYNKYQHQLLNIHVYLWTFIAPKLLDVHNNCWAFTPTIGLSYQLLDIHRNC